MRPRLTTHEFIERCQAVHGNIYDYSLVEYKNAHTKVKVICPAHGVVEMLPTHHQRGVGCGQCKGDRVRRNRRDTLDEFVAKARRVHGDKYDYSKVDWETPRLEKITVVCREHGPFEQLRQNHLVNGCPRCALRSSYQVKTAVWNGRTVKYRGFEILAADYLVNEKDIDPAEVRFDLDGEVPKIQYMLASKRRRHEPDMFVPSQNLLVEVKSEYTFFKEYHKNLVKMVAARRSGYRYVFLVMDKNGKRLYGYDDPVFQIKRGAGRRKQPAKVVKLWRL